MANPVFFVAKDGEHSSVQELDTAPEMREPTVEEYDEEESDLHRYYRFANGYGASLVSGDFGETWDLAVIRFTSAFLDFEIVEDSHITAHLPEPHFQHFPAKDVNAILEKIEALPGDDSTIVHVMHFPRAKA